MILRNLRLNPFAGVQDRVISFNDGLTVILGPNEAGKSATVNALLSVLYKKTDMKKPERDKFSSLYYPSHGGTYAEVSLQFEHLKNDCTLTKRWSASPQFHFQYGAHRLDEELKWEEFLRKHFFPEATSRNILIISQMKLSATLEMLKNEKESLNSLGDVIRKAVLSTDGISIDALQKNIDEKHAKYFSRWDAASDRPEKGHDIDNPWKKEIGIILAAYYEKRRKEVELKAAQDYELEYDAWNKQYFAEQNTFAALDAYSRNFVEVYNGAKKRESKAELVKRIEYELQEFSTIQKEWPKSEVRLEMIREQEAGNIEKLAKTEAELKDAEAYAKLKQSAEKFAKVEALKNELEKTQQRFAALQIIKKEDIVTVEQCEREAAVNKGKLEAQKLNVRMTGLNDTAFAAGWTKDTLETKNLKKDEQSRSEFSGSFAFRTENIFVEVFSGNEAVETLIASIKSNETRIETILASCQVETKAALAVKYDAFIEAERGLKALETRFNETLGTEDYGVLQKAAAALAQKPSPRDKELIQQEIALLQKEIGAISADCRSLERSLKQWQEKYGSLDKVNDFLGDKKSELKTIKQELESFPPLPPEFENAGMFIAHYEENSKTRDEVLSKLNQLKIVHASLDAGKPEYSVEDLTAELQEAIVAYDRVKKDAAALVLIREELLSIRKQLDGNTFEPLQRSISKYISRLTLDKYAVPALDEYLPSKIQGSDGALAVSLLSAGTLDALALSVRLAMAEELLAAREGFVIMDDPLINLDPARKKASAETIRKFAEEGRQVVVFTCEPAHAELFGVEVMKLSGRTLAV